MEKPSSGIIHVIRAKSAGFCWGVERAIDIARELAVEGQKTVYTDGPLIHNKQMMGRLTEEGIREVGDYQSRSDLDVKPEDNSVMVVRAHGVSPERRKYLKSLGLQFKDATCPDVGIIAGKIRLHARKGYVTVIFGDPNHPEVIGLMGYTESKGYVIQTEDDLQKLPSLGEKVVMVSQSTMFTHEFERLSSILKSKYQDLVIIDTICGATKERQSDVVELVKQGARSIVVIGGRHSANTKKLAKLAEQQGLPTFHIETPTELDFEVLSRYSPVGVTAGASTPEFIIAEVCQALTDYQPQEAMVGVSF